MKQYTNEIQTAKLIELGFEKPRTKLPFEVANNELGYTYSIGELIEMLPMRVKGIDMTIDAYYAFEQWRIYYDASQYFCRGTHLIDALYDMVIVLKKEGVL